MIPPLSQPPQAGHDPGSVEEAAQLLAQAVMGLSDLEDGLPGAVGRLWGAMFWTRIIGGSQMPGKPWKNHLWIEVSRCLK